MVMAYCMFAPGAGLSPVADIDIFRLTGTPPGVSVIVGVTVRVPVAVNVPVTVDVKGRGVSVRVTLEVGLGVAEFVHV